MPTASGATRTTAPTARRPSTRLKTRPTRWVLGPVRVRAGKVRSAATVMRSPAAASAFRTGRSWAGRESRSIQVQRSLEGVGKPADELLPEQLTIPSLAAAAEDCEACDLHARATQTVFGEGGAPSTVMLVGEQPGDREAVEGRPFVRPAGRFLDSALDAAGIDRQRCYLSTIGKPLTSVARGQRRIHQS